jgi:hypothetical protein
MCINSPINDVYKLVLDAHNIYTLRIEVEGHVFVTFDIHESAINSEKWIG